VLLDLELSASAKNDAGCATRMDRAGCSSEEQCLCEASCLKSASPRWFPDLRVGRVTMHWTDAVAVDQKRLVVHDVGSMM